MKASVLVFALLAGAAAAHGDIKSVLIQAMNQEGCRMTASRAENEMRQMGFDQTRVPQVLQEMRAEGIVTFAADEETLLLLPPACYS